MSAGKFVKRGHDFHILRQNEDEDAQIVVTVQCDVRVKFQAAHIIHEDTASRMDRESRLARVSGNGQRLQAASNVHIMIGSVKPSHRALAERDSGRSGCAGTDTDSKEPRKAALAQKGEKMADSSLSGFLPHDLNLILDDGKLCHLIEK